MTDIETVDPVKVALHSFDLLTDRCVNLLTGSTIDICGVHRCEMHAAERSDVYNAATTHMRFTCSGVLNEAEFQEIQLDKSLYRAKRDRAYQVTMGLL